MYKEIKIGDQSVPMRSSAATQYRFKGVFGTDLMSALSRAYKSQDAQGEIVELVPKLGFIMARQADNEKDWGKINLQTFLDWADQFDSSDMNDALGDILTTYNQNTKTTSTPKNPGGAPSEK